jgi:hypothetical protein
MALVVQLINRAGVASATHRFHQDRVILGRALDCDLVLQDPHVDAHHLEVTLDQQTGRLSGRDLGSLNGTWRLAQSQHGVLSKKKTPLSQASPFFSGQVFEFGKTHVRVCSSMHEVAPPLPLSRWEALGHAMAHWWIYCFLGLLMVALQVWDSYLSEPSAKKLSQFALSALYPLLAAVVYAGVWAFIGKNIRQDNKFTSHLTAALTAVVLVAAFEFITPYWAFHWEAGHWQDQAVTLFTAAIVFFVGFISLSFATHLQGFGKGAVAMVAPTLLLIPLILDILGEPEFHSAPPYDRTLVEPNWQFRQPGEVDDFLAATRKLYPEFREESGTHQPAAE